MMDLNKKTSLTPLDINELTKPTGNIYESTVIITKYAKQLVLHMKKELNHKLEEFSSITEEKDSIDAHRQYEIVQYYEKLPKPILEATKAFLTEDLAFRYIDDENEQKNELDLLSEQGIKTGAALPKKL